MDIRINTDNHITNSSEYSETLSEELRGRLKKFESHITTVEVHLADENSAKGGGDDKRCSIEVRLEGLSPLAASDKGATLKEAFHGACKKVERVVSDALQKQRAR